MSTLTRLAALLLALSVSAGVSAQATSASERSAAPVLRPGDPALDTSWMRDQTTRYVIRLVEPMQMDAGTTTSTRTVANGVVTVTTTIDVPQQGMTITTTATADAATLAPKTSASTGGPATTSLTYSPGHVAGTTASGSGTASPVAADLDGAVFDGAWTMGIAQSLPLEAGYTATAETYDAEQGVQSVTYTVSGPAPGVLAPSWTVTATTSAGPIAYVINGATRQVMSMRMSPQPGVAIEMTPAP